MLLFWAMPWRLLLSIVICATPVSRSKAESLSDLSVKTLLNTFIATYAKAEIAWKKDIRLNENPQALAPGRQLGQSSLVGLYSYLPKTWEDLTPAQQTALLKDPRLKAFLISSRQASSEPPTAIATQANTSEQMAVTPTPANPVIAVTPKPLAPVPMIIKISPAAVLAGEKVRIDFK